MRKPEHSWCPVLFGGAICLLVLIGVVTPAHAEFQPLFDSFPDRNLDPSNWHSASDADVSSYGEGEPSEPYAARLRERNTLSSQLIDTSGVGGVLVSYAWQRTGSRSMNSPEPGEDLIVEYATSLDYWKSLVRNPGDCPDCLPFRQ